jgi:DNA adenine methylase
MEIKKMNLADYGELFRADPVTLTDQELLSMDYILHSAWALVEASQPITYDTETWDAQDLIGLHAVVLQEMTRRGFQHTLQDALQEQTIAILMQDAQDSADDAAGVEKGVRQAFGSYGGKRYLAHRIASYIPFHKTYVEPFAGGAAVLYAKDPSPNEVLNDKDSEIAFMHKFIRDHSIEDRNALAKREWRILKDTHERLKAMTPETDRDRFYKDYYLTRSSYGKQRGKGFNHANAGVQIDFEKNIERAQARLKNVVISNKDYQQVLKEYDGENTFFYIDPPYPGTFNLFDLGFKEDSFLKALKSLKANWIVSYPYHRKEALKDYNLYTVKRRNQMSGAGGNKEWVKELMASNMELKPLNIYIDKGLVIEPYDEENAAQFASIQTL